MITISPGTSTVSKTDIGTLVPRASPLRVDVREYAAGFAGTDAAENTAALRAIAAQVKTAGGGIVQVPFADFPVDCTSSIPLENTPGNIVTYEALTANGLAATAIGSRIRRTAGTLPVLKFEGTGNSGSTRARGGLRHLELDGGGIDADVAVFSRCNELELPVLSVVGGSTDNIDYGGVVWQQVWNTHIGFKRLLRCGGSRAAWHVKPWTVAGTGDTTNTSNVISDVANAASFTVGYKLAGTGIPAATTITHINADGANTLRISANATATGADVALTGTDPIGACDSTMVNVAKWEVCKGIEYKADAAFGNYHGSQMYGTVNVERQLAAMTHRVFDLLDIELFISNLLVKLSPADGTSAFFRVDTSDGTLIPQVYLGNAYLSHGGSPTEYIDVQRGTFQWGRLRMAGNPTGSPGKYLKIGSSVAHGAVGPSMPLVGDVAKLTSDSRTYTIEPFGARSLDLAVRPDPAGTSSEVAVTGAADSMGVAMSGTADSKLFARVAAPADLGGIGSGATSLRVRCTIDGVAGTGGADTMRFSATIHKVAAGSLITGGTASASAQSVAVPAVLGVREFYLSTGHILARGEELLIVVRRLASSDAADNYPERCVVLGVDVLAY